MKINFDTKLMGLKIIPIKSDKEEGLSLKDVTIKALLLSDESKRTIEEKNQAYLIAEKLDNSDIIDLTIDEILFIKNEIGKTQPSLIVGNCYKILDGKE